MMSSGVTHNKVYIEIVKKLKEMVERRRFKAGRQGLPSERELSERLSVGRSSVREDFAGSRILGID